MGPFPFIFNIVAGAVCMLACTGIADCELRNKDELECVFIIVMLFGIANWLSAGVIFVQNVIM